MNYQGVVLPKIIAPTPSAGLATKSGEANVAGLESYILNSACLHGFKACVVTAQ
jgi:hypothetical protein